jgi:KUP system potassium uptake protein
MFLVSSFRSSAALGNAYGLAVTGTMVVTTSLAFVVVRRLWKWPLVGALALVAPLLALDLVFLAANALKIPSGGWLPLLIGAALILVMLTWIDGTRRLSERVRDQAMPLADLGPMLTSPSLYRAPGTAIFLASDPTSTPMALLHNLKHNKVLHARNLILTLKTAATPRVAEAERVAVTHFDDTFTLVAMRFGFMERPNVPHALIRAAPLGLKVDLMTTSFFVGRRSVVHSPGAGIPTWRFRLFAFLLRNAEDPTSYFGIPPGRVVELGSQVSV